MREPDKILHDLDSCAIKKECNGCSYDGESACTGQLMREAHALIGSMLNHGDAAYETTQAAPQPPEPWTREKVLDEARECVCGQREQDYGSPEDNFKRIANLWTAYMAVEITPVDVAMMMSLLKTARIKTGTGTMDSFVDGCGYFACGAEIASREAVNKE